MTGTVTVVNRIIPRIFRLRPNSIQDWFNPVDDDILQIQGGLNALVFDQLYPVETLSIFMQKFLLL